MSKRTGSLSINSENIFPIIKKWLYSDHDIFAREVISNGCDAITKLAKLEMMGEYEYPDGYKKEIQVIVNPKEKTLKFIDTGLGMTAAEVEEYITQIAFSGATDFLNKYKDKTTNDEIIGHFGLGFYSVFMVADEVHIDTLSYQKDAKPVHWECDGGTEYSIEEGSRTQVGTEITLFLSEDCLEFANEYRMREVITKYCSFMPVEIFLSKANAEQEYETIDEEDLKELLLFISSAISTFANPKKLAARFKSIKHSLISEPTVATYIEHFEEIFLIKKALRYDVKRTTYISTPYKVYFEDVGIRNGVLSYRQIEPTHLMENVIFNELRFRGYSVDVGQIEVRDKIKDEQTGLEKEIKKYLETDFVANEGSNRFYIQSVYLIDGPEKREQETRSLLNIKDSFKKVIITYNNVFDGYDNNGIYYLDFYRFLIDENSLYK